MYVRFLEVVFSHFSVTTKPPQLTFRRTHQGRKRPPKTFEATKVYLGHLNRQIYFIILGPLNNQTGFWCIWTWWLGASQKWKGVSFLIVLTVIVLRKISGTIIMDHCACFDVIGEWSHTQQQKKPVPETFGGPTEMDVGIIWSKQLWRLPTSYLLQC